MGDPRVVGVLLAGGQSRRMGGGDKNLLSLDGRPMLAHVIERLAPQVGALVLNANGDPSRFGAFGLAVAPDSVPGFAGPLAGVLAGMLWARKNAPAATFIVTAATDTPFFPRDLVARLIDGAKADAGTIALAASCGRTHPVFGLWPIALADDLEQALHDDVRKVLAWVDRHPNVTITFAAPQDPFFNVNTPEDRITAEARLKEAAS